MKRFRTHFLSSWCQTSTCLCIFCLMSLAVATAAFGYGDGGGNGGGSGGAADKTATGINRRGPAVEPTIGIEGMPVMPQNEWENPWWQSENEPKPITKRNPTFEEKVATAIIDYTANKAQDHLQDMMLDFVLASNPEVIAAIKVAQGIHKGVVLTAEVLRKIQKEKKAYEKAIMGARNSNQVATGPDGAAGAPGQMNPNFPGCGYGMPGPQREMDSNQSW